MRRLRVVLLAVLGVTAGLASCDTSMMDLGTGSVSDRRLQQSANRLVDNTWLMIGCAAPVGAEVRTLRAAWDRDPERIERALRTMRRRGQLSEVDGLTVYTGGSCGYCRKLIREGRGETCPDLDMGLFDAADRARRAR